MDKLERAASELQLPPIGDEADWLGRLDKVIRHLRDLRADVLAELDGPVSGNDYKVTESHRAKRSYNSAAIVAAMAQKGLAMRDAYDADAARISWSWTGLKRFLHANEIPLMVAPREVEDLGDIDEPMIGEVWETVYKVEGNA